MMNANWPEEMDMDFGEDTTLCKDLEVANPQLDHLPVVLLLDTSGSMSGNPINELNNGLKQFFSECLADTTISKCVDLMIVTYGGRVKVEVPFTTFENIQFTKELFADGGTPMAEAALKAIDEIKKQHRLYKSNGVQTYKAFVLNITDGEPTDPPWKIEESRNKIIKYENNKIVGWYNVGVENANISFLNEFGTRPAKKLRGLSFLELFRWLKCSISLISQSRPGENVGLPPTDSWAEH